PPNLAALWLIGFEDEPDRSGEITVMEIFGTGVGDDTVEVGRGVKKIKDPSLREEFYDNPQPIRVDDWHVYAIDWRPNGIDFLLDERVISRSSQSPDYPMQLMLNVYDLGTETGSVPQTAGWFDVDYVRAYQSVVG
ncbi:MAG: glycoside hydrolase family 16 protein, partial [Pseudomonadota bacterium]